MLALFPTPESRVIAVLVCRMALFCVLMTAGIAKIASEHKEWYSLAYIWHYAVAVAEMVLAVAIVLPVLWRYAAWVVLALSAAITISAVVSPSREPGVSCGCLGALATLSRSQEVALGGCLGTLATLALYLATPPRLASVAE